MSYDAMDIAGTALSAERLRMDVISANIANAKSTHNNKGQYSPYERKVVTFQTIFDETNSNNQQVSNGVTVTAITADASPLRRVYNPSHPDANQDGFVFFPNVSIEKEMADMASAKAAFQANVTSIQTFKAIFNSALEI